MLANFWNAIIQFIEAHPVLFTFVGAIFGSILTAVGIFSRQIGNFIARIAKFIRMKMQGRGADHHFEHVYLDWLIREHRHLGLLPAQLITRGWRERQNLASLEAVFVQLSISSQGGDERWAESYGHGEPSWRRRPWVGLRFASFLITRLLPFRFLKRLPLFTEQTYQPGDLGLVVDRNRCLVIGGDPGSGKTTLLKYLALTCARALRNNRDDGDARNTVKKRLFWTQRPFPMLVRLRRHANVASWDETKGLTDMLLQEMPFELRKECPTGFFERYLKRGNCLILLDAFDELGNAEARAAMARKVAGFLAIYTRNDNRIVVTTRIIGYERQLDQYDFVVRTVQNLKAGEVRALVKQRYAAIALAEANLRPTQEKSDIQQRMRERASRLIEKVEDTSRLAQLATNPMLLSLMVLIHSLNIELPEERLLLYRDCVEILAESWQQKKLEDVGITKAEREGLGLNQKLVLLYELAFEMQQERKDAESSVLMPKAVAQDLIARKLPDLPGGALSQSELAKGETYHDKAGAWIAGIQTDSGILVEQGFDEAGEPLISFSHLTFQEYLAAMAIHEDKARLAVLRRNLLQPAWREVVLLYAASVSDATSTLKALLKSPTSARAVLLAGSCLAERPKKVQGPVQQMALEKLKEGFTNADDDMVGDFGKVMAMLPGSEIITFMRPQLGDPSLQKQLAAIKALGQTKRDAAELEQVRADLLQMLETANEPAITVATREALSQIGDPRFLGPEPVLVHVPQQPQKVPLLMRTWKDLKTLPEWKAKKNTRGRLQMFMRVIDYRFLWKNLKASTESKTTKNIRWRFQMFVRVIDYQFFTIWRAFRRHCQQNQEFEIGKYPVTNAEYRRFVEATEHAVPEYWKEGTFPRKEATHPVVGVTNQDAKAYCRWLSHETGRRYRLPTEWEWEWAAASSRGWKYPWGDQFDKDRCNTEEAGVEGTTPVGSYKAGNSLCGASDMSGNVWEITSNTLIVGIGVLAILLALSVIAIINTVTMLVAVVAVTTATTAAAVTSVALLVATMLLALVGEGIPIFTVSRGGAWNTVSDKATCFFYRNDGGSSSATGFRCLREADIPPNP